MVLGRKADGLRTMGLRSYGALAEKKKRLCRRDTASWCEVSVQRGLLQGAAAEGLVEVDGGGDDGILVGQLSELGVEEAGLGGQHVEVVDLAADIVLVEGLGGVDSVGEGLDLSADALLLALCCLQGDEGGVDFVAGCDEALLERNLSFFLLEDGDFLLCNETAVLEDGLCEGGEGVPNPLGGIELDGGAVVGVAEGAADVEGGVEGCVGAVDGVEGAGELELGLLDVGAVGEQGHGDTGVGNGGGLEAVEAAALDVVGCFAKEGAEEVLDLDDALAQVVDIGLDAVAVGLALGYGCFVGAAGLHELAGDFNIVAPVLGGLLADGQLGIEHAEGVVEAGDVGHEGLLHGLLGGAGLLDAHLCLLLGVAEAAEAAYLPGG